MKAKTFNISLPDDLLKLVDQQARLTFQSRSSYIRQGLLLWLKYNGVYHEETAEDQDVAYQSRRRKLREYIDSIITDKDYPYKPKM